MPQKISVFAKFIASLCAIFFTFLTSSAQVTIGTVDEPVRINICGDGIDKNGNSSEVGITASGSGNFNVQLPIGFHYIVGSVTGATQSNVSNDNNPIFTFVSSPVKIKISADCNFTASRVISVTGGNTALSDNIPNVDAPNVFQSSWTNDVLNNAVGW